jgi:uncharacterized protein
MGALMQTDRRFLLKASAAGVVALWSQAGYASAVTASSGKALGFSGVPVSAADGLTVPPEYEASVIFKWGDPIGLAGNLPAFKPDAGNSAAEQAVQMGMHHDGMHFFALDANNERGLLVMNHEYTDENALHTDGTKTMSAEKVLKSQHAVGVSVVEVRKTAKGYEPVLPSKYARRIHAQTPMAIAGPAAGHALMKTTFDPTGTRVLGTYSNCAMGVTPWGTYLTCEENNQGNFGGKKEDADKADANQRRYGVVPGQQWAAWHLHDERFDIIKHPNESNRFNWVVEIDPFDPTSTPIKRSALGRKRQESATVTTAKDGRVVVYMGDDARFEYIYKFVSQAKVQKGGYSANKTILDHGTLYVARFDTNGKGQWLELTQGKNGLSADKGFADQGDVVIKARLAADLLGATKMDRPEWIAVHPQSGEVFVTLTNNSQRGDANRPGPDAANPRSKNLHGHITKWREAAGDAAATSFEWSHFVLAGDPSQGDAGTKYPHASQADIFGSPDGLYFDSGGLLWIQTDMSGQAMNKGAYEKLGNNAMLCANVATGEIKRFLVAPSGSEVTGCVLTPDRKALFVNIQHPGESNDGGEGAFNSTWPDGGLMGQTRPRSATVVVRRKDGGLVGT